jgi:prepilin-type N-terminal cleavage/methylation domain-containing protein
MPGDSKMNKDRMSRQSPFAGFSLLELIVVVGVIAILMAILLPVVTGVKDGARQRSAEATRVSLENAIRMYRTEYGYWPGPTPDANSTYTNSNQGQLIQYLLSTYGPGNPRGIPFWETAGVVTNIYTKQPFTITIDVNSNTVTVL